MKIGITPLIAANFVPPNVKGLTIFNGNTKVCDVDISKMQLPNIGTKLYSLSLVSDLHFSNTSAEWNPDGKLDKALTFFESYGCVFCANAGDITQTGFFNEGDAVNFAPEQFSRYKAVCDKHSIPVYSICGNHESYVNPIINNMTELELYTGKGLYYSVSQGDDLYVFIGQPQGNRPMTDEALQWLCETLEVNRNKRCLVLVHPHLSSGNPLGAYTSNNFFQGWGTKTTAFKNLLCHYKNTILVHGHSHTKFECQALDKKANYNADDGFRSLHIPSLGRPRTVVDGALGGYDNAGSEGYIVDVYENHMVFKGYDFIANDIVPIAQYCIDTALVNVPANTFTDSTGIITK